MKETVDDTDFVKLVTMMRQAQKDYFSTRDKQTLNASKLLERQVDRYIDEFNNPSQELKFT